MYIFILLKENIKHKKGAFKSIIFLMFIIALAMTTIVSTSGNIRLKLEEAMEETGAGDLLVILKDGEMTEELDKAVNDYKYVERTRNFKVFEPSGLMVKGKNSVVPMICASETANDNKSFKVFNKEQDDFIDNPEPLKKGEIYVPLAFQSLLECDINDEVSFTTEEGIQIFKIKGFVQEPFFGAYVIDTKQVYISEADYSRIVNMATSITKVFNEYTVFMKKDSDLSVAQLKRELNERSGLINHAYSTLSQEDSMGYTTMFTDIFSGMLIAFVVLLGAIMLIVMGHSISTGIEMEYANLGILKSLGFTKGRLRFVLGLQYFMAEIIGAITGILAAIPCVKTLGTVFQPITGIMAAPDIDYPKCIVIIVLMIVVCNIFVLYKTAKISRISPVKAINGGHEVIYFDSRLRIHLGEKALNVRLAMRQLFTGAKQYIGLVIIAAILVYFMMAVTTLATCMTPKALQENFGAVLSDISLIINEKFDTDKIDEIEHSINEISPIEETSYSAGSYYTLDGYEYFGRSVYDPEDVKSVIDGRAPLYDNEIVITEVVANELDKKIGDRVVVSHGKFTADYLISGLYQSTNDAGRCFSMSLETSEKLDVGNLSRGYISLEDDSRISEVSRMLNDKYSDILKAERTKEDGGLVYLIQLALDIVSAIIYVISGVFALIVVHMVCGKTFIKERHDIGIYKAIGFTSVSLRMQFVARFVIVALLGACLGAIIYASVNDILMSRMFYAMGISQFVTEYHAITLIMPLVFICVCFCVFSYFSTRKVKSTVCRNIAN